MAKKRTLLLITCFFPPCAASATYRSLGFAQHLPAHGWNVAVVAPPTVRWEPEDQQLAGRLPPETIVERVPFPSDALSRLAQRRFYFQTWRAGAWKAIQRMIADIRPDAVFTTSPPGSIVELGIRTKMTAGIPWVACFRDPIYTNRIADHGGDTLSRLLDRRYERRTVRWADHIIVNTPSNAAAWHRAYPHLSARITHLTNGFDPELFARSSGPKPRATGDVIVLHAGELYGRRDPRGVLKALAMLRDRSGPRTSIKLKLLGNVEGRTALESDIAGLGIQDLVEVHGHAPYSAAIDAMLDSDILLAVQMTGPQVAIPAKIYEYIGAGKPVLVIAEPGGDIDWALETAGVPHRVVSPTDENAIAQALSDLASIARDPSLSPSHPEKTKLFTRRHTAGVLAQILDEVCSA